MSENTSLTLADVARRLCEIDLPDGPLRDLVSAINSTAELLHRNPSEVPADIGELRKRLASIHHVQAGISPKRLANIKSDLSAALRALQRNSGPNAPNAERSEQWGQFIQSCEQPWQRHLLARLSEFCSSIGVEPKDVNDDTLCQFGNQLDDSSIAKPPEKKLKRIAQTWNGLVQRATLPYRLLSIPRSDRYRASPCPAFLKLSRQTWTHGSFGKVMSISLRTMARQGLSARFSLRNVKATVRQFASALVARGRPIDSITSLGSLVERNAFKEGLRFFLDRNHGEPTTWLWGMGGALLAIARYHVQLPAADIDALATIRCRLKVDTDSMTEKNRRRLAQFDDDYNVELLLLLPRRLADRATRAKQMSSRVALEVMHAVAIEFLLVCAIRMNNLAAIDIERHLHWRGAGTVRRSRSTFPPRRQRTASRSRPIFRLNWRASSGSTFGRTASFYRTVPATGCFRRRRAGRTAFRGICRRNCRSSSIEKPACR